ncbi:MULTISPECIES: acyltransferase [unclassified Pannonibacter]|uniref:acyltransferase family protein n=1 Tax=unclassified Pannonibacter TaxID=2627228 RepID=UPI001644D56F|nr:MULTISPECIES: acyltransferase [unclassified Pannonibacter]
MSIRFLKDYDGNRENNFTLLRTLFALLVLFGHSYPITGNGYDPISLLIVPHTAITQLAVGGFFAISGFLITASFAGRGAIHFIISRGLRLYPGIIMFCVIATLVIGPLGSNVSLGEYFATVKTTYFQNAPLWSWQMNLPFNFMENPFPGSTNGSMWTLPVELRSYLLVLGLGIMGVWRRRAAANLMIIGLLYLVVYGPDLSFIFSGETRYQHPLTFFLMGCAAWANRDYIPLSGPLAVLALVVPLFALWGPYFLLVHAVCTAYVIFYLAYRTPHVDLDRFGDVSYGVYIYAWPIQQLVWWPGQGGITNALVSALVVIPIAYLSWRLVEKPALALRHYLGKPRSIPLQNGGPA